MPEPDERLSPAPPEPTPPLPAEVEGLPTGWRAVAPDLRPLRRHRDYRLLTVGQSVSFFGSMVTYVAVPYQVYELTGSSLAVGMVGVVQMAAILALAFLGGALADAADRRRLVRWSEAGELACCVALLVNAFSFLLAAVGWARIRLPERVPAESRRDEESAGVIAEMREGVRFIRKYPLVRSLILGVVGVMFGAGVVVTLGPEYVRSVLGRPDVTAGCLRS